MFRGSRIHLFYPAVASRERRGGEGGKGVRVAGMSIRDASVMLTASSKQSAVPTNCRYIGMVEVKNQAYWRHNTPPERRTDRRTETEMDGHHAPKRREEKRSAQNHFRLIQKITAQHTP